MKLTFLNNKTGINKTVITSIEHGQPIVYLLMVIVLSIVIWFLYNNVYVPLTRAVEIAELKETTAVVRPDSELLDETIKKGQQRKAGLDTEWDKIKNPFIESPSSLEENTEETISVTAIDTQL